MKNNVQVFLLCIFVFALGACVPVPVVVGPQDSGYNYHPRYDDQSVYDDYGYGYDEKYYDVPVVYGEPCYYAPPIAVTFAFDYFTYEVVGGYVDIVFWKGGHRYNHEPWYEHGRRITPGYIQSGDFHHRVRGSELYKHRKMLRENNNIYHPHEYYGVKPPSRIQQEKQGQLRDRERQEQEKQRQLRERQFQEKVKENQLREYQQQEQKKQKQLKEYQQHEQEQQKQLKNHQKQEQEKQRQLKDRQKQEQEKRQQEKEKKSKERDKKSEKEQQQEENERGGHGR